MVKLIKFLLTDLDILGPVVKLKLAADKDLMRKLNDERSLMDSSNPATVS